MCAALAYCINSTAPKCIASRDAGNKRLQTVGKEFNNFFISLKIVQGSLCEFGHFNLLINNFYLTAVDEHLIGSHVISIT